MAYVVVGFAVYETLTLAVVLAFLATIAIPLTGVARSASRPADAVTYFGIDLRPAEVRPGELLMGFTLGPNETRAATLDVTDFCEWRVVPRGGPTSTSRCTRITPAVRRSRSGASPIGSEANLATAFKT